MAKVLKPAGKPAEKPAQQGKPGSGWVPPKPDATLIGVINRGYEPPQTDSNGSQ